MIRRALLLFMVFPFTQILPLPTYNQPYALMTAGLVLLARISILTRLRQTDRLALFWLAGIGTLGLLIEAVAGLNLREVQYWIAYVSPLFIVPAAVWAISVDRAEAVRIVEWGVLAWVALGLVQLTVAPNALTFLVAGREDLGSRILESGRGVLAFAPEPTHHGFHLLLLAGTIALLGGRRWIALLAVAAAVLVARSAGAAMALALGFAIWCAVSPVRRGWLLGAGAAAGLLLLPILLIGDDLRIVQVFRRGVEGGIGVFLMDASVNMRFSGSVMPIRYALSNGLIPFGLSQEMWLDIRDEILTRHRWIYALSENGPATGFGLILLQGGWLALPPLALFAKRFLWDNRDGLGGFLAAVAFAIFLNQIYISAASFGLVLAALICARRDVRPVHPRSGPAPGRSALATG